MPCLWRIQNNVQQSIWDNLLIMYLSFTSSRVLKHPSYRFLYYLESVTFSFTICFFKLSIADYRCRCFDRCTTPCWRKMERKWGDRKWVLLDLSFSGYLCNFKRLLYDIFHIGPGISPRLPYQARQLEGWYGSRVDTRDHMENFMS